MIPYILIFWSTYGQVKIPATAEFTWPRACEAALVQLKEKGFDGICVAKYPEDNK